MTSEKRYDKILELSNDRNLDNCLLYTSSLGKFDKYELVYVWYDYKVKKQKETLEVPAMSFYYVKKKDKKSVSYTHLSSIFI